MADVTDIINYYVNLLIIQYHDRPKAMATIDLLAQTLLASGVMLDVQNGYNIDTAVGKQLDVIGKYVGVTRYFSQINLLNYFSLVTYAESTSLPASPTRWGFSTYATFDNYDYNGTLIYDDIVTSSNALSDSDFRILIRLAIIINNSNYSWEKIDSDLFALFAGLIRFESTGDMTMTYFITGAVSTLIQAILIKKLLPKPMGVLINTVTDVTSDMFALTDYTGYMSPYGYGFSQYANYDTLPGEVLTYSQISTE